MPSDLARQDTPSVNVDRSTPSPSFIVSPLHPQDVSPHPPSRSANPSAWPISYEVHTLEHRGRSATPSPLLLSASQPDFPAGQQSSPRTAGHLNPPPFASPPSTPGASLRSFASSSSDASNTPSLAIPAHLASFPPTHPRPVDLDNNKSYLCDDPADAYPPPSVASFPRPMPRRASEQGSLPGLTQIRLRSRARTSRTAIPGPAGTPPASPGERTSFASPPVRLGNGTPPRGRITSAPPANLPASATPSAAGIRVPSPASLSDDQSYSPDPPDPPAAVHTRGIHASWSSISTQSTAGEQEASVRPSRLLQGPVRKPWLATRDRRARASWWITVVRAVPSAVQERRLTVPSARC